MKIKNIIPILFFFVAIIFNSCTKEDFDPVLEITNVPAFTAPATGGSYVLIDADADNVFTTFKWNKAIFNINIEVSYILEVDLAANNFANPVTMAILSNDTTFETTVFNFNKLLTTELGLTSGVAKEIAIRIGTPAEADSSARTYSEPITMTVTPYDPPFTPENLFVFSNGAKIGVLKPVDTEGNYEGYVWIAAADLSFTLSDAETGGILIGDNGDNGIAEFDGDAFISAMIQVQGSIIFNKGAITEGYHKININTFDMTYEVVQIASWSVIGSAINPYAWNGDIDLTYDIATGVWSATIIDIHTGEFKFRPNHSWDPLNYGDDGADGLPDEYGANIPITIGPSYTITLDLREYPYSYSVVAN